ncbi:MAG TPA: fused MFS/spermidine synthase [Vicinamibacterales bacterium]|nr:fused MFS/spermidine synthase [Vicinamibacterales bacterium]
MRLLFSLTALLGAFLLFLVEPMFARMVLPLLGGAPAVWNTCLVFYQVALLGGYLYAHGVSRRPHRHQVLLQVVLLVATAVVLPIAVRGGGVPPPSANPIGWVFWILLVSLGLPFVVLATTGPLLQRWYASLGPQAATTVYSLFSASNAGSFLALLGYPLLVEPMLRLRTQSLVWTVGFGVYALLMVACGAAAWRLAPPAPAPSVLPTPQRGAVPRRRAGTAAGPVEEDDVWADRLRWLGLAAVPSTLMMSVTTFISTDVASMPLLWVVPLALYLLTFVIAFSERQWLGPRLLEWLFANAVVVTIALVMAPAVYPLALIVAHLACFFIVALACHSALAASRPPAESLTEFYLWLSAGGAAGGLFNTLVAPVIFVNPFEYPLAVLSACLLLPNALASGQLSHGSRIRQVVTLGLTALPVLLVALIVPMVQRYDAALPTNPFFRFVLIFGPACLASFALRRTPLRMGIALATLVVAGTFVRFDNRVPIHLERSFFGLHRVMFSGREHVLLSGTTNHGAQSIDPRLKCEPLTYYSREGPVGQLVAHVTSEGTGKRFGVVGLGTASLAAYASAGQSWTFFEINPAVERLARDPEYFTYLRDCGPQSTVITGDARLMLVRQPDAAFDVLILDAFSSDAIPVHLITLEAMQLYLRKLAPGGIMAVHISNRYLDLAPVVGATARRAGLIAVVQTHAPTPEEAAISAEISPSRWVLVTRRDADLGTLGDSGRWSTLADVEGPVWTDDYSNVLGVLRR